MCFAFPHSLCHGAAKQVVTEFSASADGRAGRTENFEPQFSRLFKIAADHSC